ncbi:MAG TPA: hypothetical protein VNM50_04695 [Chloroflexota bacterium]|nr:hypothetical protein [Chloroflexota bacterium]
MTDIRGVGKRITYSENNPAAEWVRNLRRERDKLKREPRNDEERILLARWLGYRGRDELECIVGSAAYAYTHFAAELDSEWRYILADHMGTEAGHGWGYIRLADQIDPSRDHSQPDPEFSEQYGVYPSQAHAALMRRDFLSYLFAGNLWPYGPVTAATIQSILITTPQVLDFERRVVEAEERGHHDAALQKIHDYVWQLIDRYGEAYVRKRIAEIDEAALNAGSRIIFDPPRRDFLRKYFDVPLENTTRFLEYREYLYLNVLGFPPEPIYIKTWPKEIPQPTAAVA